MTGETARWLRSALAGLAEATGAGVSVLRLDGDDAVVEWVSPSTERGVGDVEGGLIGRSFRAIYPPEVADDVLGRVDAARRGEAASYETVRDLPTGRYSVRVSIVPLGDDRVLMCGVDVSSEREVQRRLDEVTRVAHIGLYQWNVVDDELWWSEQLYRILGLDPSTTRPTIDTIFERVHPEDLDAVRLALDAVAAEDPPVALAHRIVLPDGTVRFVEARPHAVSDGEGCLVYLFGTVQDITEHVELERQAELLRAATARQRIAVELHDRVVQGLSAVWLALDLGDLEVARQATEHATTEAEQIVADLLGDLAAGSGGIRPGDLVHRHSLDEG